MYSFSKYSFKNTNSLKTNKYETKYRETQKPFMLVGFVANAFFPVRFVRFQFRNAETLFSPMSPSHFTTTSDDFRLSRIFYTHRVRITTVKRDKIEVTLLTVFQTLKRFYKNEFFIVLI